jgi:putative endopeptidase
LKATVHVLKPSSERSASEITSPDFLRGVEKLLRQRSLRQWKAYLRWNVLHASADSLPGAFVEENFDFFSRTLSGAQKLPPRWRRCVHSADRDLGDALGRAYVERVFPPGSKQRVLEMVTAIESALAADIQELDWMSASTRHEALLKLQAVKNKIGYPSRWKDYSGVTIVRDHYLQDTEEAANYEFERWVRKIGKPVDREEWTMTPPTINAYYSSAANSINLPAGILQPPFFDLSYSDAVAYGGIGKVIGHELIHGFDDQGRKFDAHGNLRDWWSAADKEAYDRRSKCISDEYTQEIPELHVKQNGLLTHGEDIADNGGIHLVLAALLKALQREGRAPMLRENDGWTPEQRFFLSDAFSFCINVRPEIMRTLVLTDPHSLPRYRVNNVLANLPEFQEAFHCGKNQPMVRQNACRVW